MGLEPPLFLCFTHELDAFVIYDCSTEELFYMEIETYSYFTEAVYRCYLVFVHLHGIDRQDS